MPTAAATPSTRAFLASSVPAAIPSLAPWPTETHFFDKLADDALRERERVRQRAEEIDLAELDPVVAQERVRGRRVEGEIGQGELQQIVDPGEFVRLAANRSRARPDVSDRRGPRARSAGSTRTSLPATAPG